ncbi:MAG TPA: DNA polymerase III subunit gamma/tau [Gammaproteobacteria bacterium]
MSYQVLARKWRPRSFPEMVGQEHVLRALINALDNDRLHHAFLFTGTRGVGKTTVARILAKSLNCETGVSSRPCGVCSACREIDEGRFVDLIEVDAASRTKVEDTRELLENVQYSPSRGRYKVYLIDEVHMLSNSSFNALLKTLEEPPPHVKFLLATTDPQKLPATILSRCLQFNLKRMAPELIRAHLATILEKEGIAAEAPALAELARGADGSMRDALSLLDQAIAFGAGKVTTSEVREMLGTIERDRVHALLGHLADGDGAALLAEVANLAEQSPDFAGVLAELISLLQRVALAQAVPAAIDDSLGDRDELLALAGRISPEDVQLFYQIGLIGRRDLPLSPEARGGFEMVLLRMLAFRPAVAEEGGKPSAPPESQRAAPNRAPAAGAAPSPSRAAPAVREPAAPVATAAAAPVKAAAPAPAQNASVAPAVSAAASSAPLASPDSWAELVAKLPIGGVLKQFAEQCALLAHEGKRIVLALDQGATALRSKAREEGLRQALEKHFGGAIDLVIEAASTAAVTPTVLRKQRNDEKQAAAEQAISDDPELQSLLEHFDGRVQPGSVRPIE